MWPFYPCSNSYGVGCSMPRPLVAMRGIHVFLATLLRCWKDGEDATLRSSKAFRFYEILNVRHSWMLGCLFLLMALGVFTPSNDHMMLPGKSDRDRSCFTTQRLKTKRRTDGSWPWFQKKCPKHPMGCMGTSKFHPWIYVIHLDDLDKIYHKKNIKKPSVQIVHIPTCFS